MHKYIRTYIHKYICTHICTYIRTYIHTYIHTYIGMLVMLMHKYIRQYVCICINMTVCWSLPVPCCAAHQLLGVLVVHVQHVMQEHCNVGWNRETDTHMQGRESQHAGACVRACVCVCVPHVMIRRWEERPTWTNQENLWEIAETEKGLIYPQSAEKIIHTHLRTYLHTANNTNSVYTCMYVICQIRTYRIHRHTVYLCTIHTHIHVYTHTHTLPFIGIRGTFAKSPTINRILTNTRHFGSSQSVGHYHWWRQQWVPKCLVFYGWWHKVQYVCVYVRTYVPTYTTQRMYCMYIRSMTARPHNAKPMLATTSNR